MKAGRWEEIQRLFQLAMEQPLETRYDFLERECDGDESLRRELESLLKAGSRAGTFLDEPALPAAARGLASAAHPHAPGDLAGPYRLDRHIGSGGMGEVWRAHDTRLGRDVALKFSAAQFTERFGAEARAIAALNHPNVCQLFDVGPNYLVMEFVEGTSPSGPLPLTAVLQYARQIADALEAAHEKGIVHRDLKPANVKVRADGTVKVLDFGIAKSTQLSPTADGSATVPGTVMGTPAWMSPEQARGLPVDKRADIWAFGVLLYYLLTGVNPFERGTANDTMAAVLTAEPGWETLPPEVSRLVRKCLEKDPKKRLRDIADAWELLDQPADSRREAGWPTRRLAVLGGIALAVAAGLGFWRASLQERAAEQRLLRFDLDLGPEVFLDASGVANFVLSPDGSALAFVSRGRLFVRSFQDSAPKQVGGVQGVHTPFFSPDGRWIAFFAQGKLRKIAVNGGIAVDLCPSSAYFAGGAWGSDGNIVATLAPSGPLQIVAAEGGIPRALTELDRSRGETTHRLPQFLPGGKAILFTTHNAITGFDDADIDVITLPEKRRKRLIHGGTFGRYVPSGHLLYVNRGVLYAVPFDADRLELRGEPAKVAEDVAYSLFGSAQFDAASSGTLVYRTGGSAVTSVTLERLHANGGRQPLLSKPGTYLNPRVSPDGRQVLLSVRGTTEMTLSVFDVRRDSLLPVQYETVTASAWSPFAIWAPDGKSVIFRGDVGTGDAGLYWARVDGRGSPKKLIQSTSNSQTPSSFSPDGRTLAFYQGSGLVGSSDIWTVAITHDGSGPRAADPKPLVETKADENQASFSRDGRWVAYTSANDAGPDTYVMAWPGDSRSWQVSIGGGSQPLFSRSRNELFFLSPDQHVMVVPYEVIGDAFVAGRPRRWSDQRLADLGETFWNYDVLPGGDSIVALTVPADSRPGEGGHLIVLLNAFDHLRRIAPAR